MSEQHVTTTGAARIANRSADTIRNWARDGILVPIMRPGGIRIFRRADVERVARERRRSANIGTPRAERGSDGNTAA